MNGPDINKAIHTYCPDVLRPTLDKIESSEVGYRVAKGAFWSMAGAVISRGLMLIASIFVARMLGKTGFGELGMIQSTVGMFGVFAGFGLGMTATKYVAEFRRSNPARAGRIISLSALVAIGTGGLMALGLFIFSPWLAEHTINAPHLAGVLRISALVLFISALNGAQTGALAGLEAFKTIAYVNLFIGLISFPVLVGGVYFGGLTGAVWALVINLFFNWLLNHLALRKEARRYKIPLVYNDCGRELSVLWKFSLPAVLAGSMVVPAYWVCNAMLVNEPDGYGEMGIFNAANQWYTILLFLPGLLGQVALPILSSLSDESTSQQYRKVLKINLLMNISITLLTVFPLFLLAHLIMSAYGPTFEHGARVFRVMAFSSVLTAANTIIAQAIISKGKMWIGFTFNFLWAIVLVLITSLLLYMGYGAYGLAWAILIAYLLHTIWQGIYLRSVLRKQLIL